MTRKKVRAMPVVSVLDDRQRFAAFVLLLLTVDNKPLQIGAAAKKLK